MLQKTSGSVSTKPDLAGRTWPELARQAASGLNTIPPAKSPITALLVDIRQVFAQSESPRLSSRELVHNLRGLGQRPWSELLAGRPLTECWLAPWDSPGSVGKRAAGQRYPTGLAHRLRPYGVRPFLLRTGQIIARGYARDAFERLAPAIGN